MKERKKLLCSFEEEKYYKQEKKYVQVPSLYINDKIHLKAFRVYYALRLLFNKRKVYQMYIQNSCKL